MQVRSLLLVLLVHNAGGAVAWAAPTGGTFAGPTRFNGAALYWNPAVAAELEPGDWAFSLDLTGSLIHLTYERDGVSPYDGKPFAPASFTSPGPDINFFGVAPTPLAPLRLLIGGFAPTLNGTRWPRNGAQRYFGTRSLFVTYAVAAGVEVDLGRRFGLALMAGPYYTYLSLQNSVDFGAFANGLLPPGTALFPLEKPLLEGSTRLDGTGWSALTVLGAWAKPVPWLKLGAGLSLIRGVVIGGTVAVDASTALQHALPGFNLSPRGQLEIHFPMPWQLSLESELLLGPWAVALMFQYIDKSIQEVILATVSEAEPDFISGRQVSVKGVRDDWRVGARVSRQLSERWELGLRFDVDPRYVPDESLNATNLDFTTLHTSVGAVWQLGPRLRLIGTYSWIYLVDFHVKNSLFNPNAPRESGMGSPSANGRYSGWAQMIGVDAEWVWGEMPPRVE